MFWLTAQLSDVTASQDQLQMKAETKTFLTRPIRARENVYLISKSRSARAEGARGTVYFLMLWSKFCMGGQSLVRAEKIFG